MHETPCVLFIGSNIPCNAYVVGQMGATTRTISSRQYHICR